MLPPDGYSPSQMTKYGASFWFTFVTVSTVGYGDIYPPEESFQGRLFASVGGVLGIIVGSLITGVVTNTLNLNTFEVDITLWRRSKLNNRRIKRAAGLMILRWWRGAKASRKAKEAIQQTKEAWEKAISDNKGAAEVEDLHTKYLSAKQGMKNRMERFRLKGQRLVAYSSLRTAVLQREEIESDKIDKGGYRQKWAIIGRRLQWSLSEAEQLLDRFELSSGGQKKVANNKV